MRRDLARQRDNEQDWPVSKRYLLENSGGVSQSKEGEESYEGPQGFLPVGRLGLK